MVCSIPLTFTLLVSLLPWFLPGQASVTSSVPERAATALERIKHDDLGSGMVDADSVIDDAAKAGKPAVPVLTGLYARTKDVDTKDQAASDLVLLGEKNPIYWDFLVQQAKAAVDSDPPYPSLFAAQPSQMSTGLSPAIIAWARSHGIKPEAAMEEITLTLNWRLIRMARIGDPRGEPVLEQALHSRSIFFQMTATMGFAAARLVSAVPAILELCKRAPTEDDARAIAADLPYFHSADADRGYLWYFSADDLAEQKKQIGKNPWPNPTMP